MLTVDDLKALGEPGRLDRLVTLNRDKARFRMATLEEMKPYMRPVQAGSIKQVLEPWHVIMFDKTGAEMPNALLLMGYDELGYPWCTSEVAAIDLEQGVIQTRNSFYKIVGPHSMEEPDLQLCMHLCGACWGWGFGGYLGMPHVFY